ncbi:MAG: CapA family protein [Muribaculaceae bacterium]|nr:CapA family protein [Muribaculaceae bacterium]
MLKTLLFSLLSFVTGASAPGDAQGADLLFVGDAMQHQAQLDRARELGGGRGYDYSGCFTYIAPAVTEADYAVCNLEVPLGGGPDYTGYPCFSAPDSYAKALKDAGFDLFLTANNHCLDRRDKAARRTIKALDELGVDHIGTYHDAADREQSVPFIKDIKGIKVGFLNYTYGTNGIPPREGVEVALIDRERMAQEIRRTREAGAEVVVVAMHWGIEYVLLPNRNQEELADFLVGQGVDMIIGGHPHVIQPMKVVRNEKEGKDVLVVYSLGNFISNMKTADTTGGALVRVRIERDADGKSRFKSASYDTLFSAKPAGGRSNFTVIPSWMPDRIPAAQRGTWQIFERGAKRIFDAHNVGVPRLHAPAD